MERKNFYYTRRVSAKDNEGKDIFLEVKDFFNIDFAIRGVWTSETVFNVLLNDGHEESKDTFDIKGHPTKRRDWYISQIELLGEDIVRFKELTEII